MNVLWRGCGAWTGARMMSGEAEKIENAREGLAVKSETKLMVGGSVCGLALGSFRYLRTPYLGRYE